MKRLIIAASILALSAAAHALPSKPAKCPSVDSIRAVGLSTDAVEQDRNDGTWAVGFWRSKYDTVDSWSFIIGKIPARNNIEAYEKAKAALASISFKSGPVAAAQINRWMCGYNNNANFVAVSVTPDLRSGKLNSVTHDLI